LRVRSLLDGHIGIGVINDSAILENSRVGKTFILKKELMHGLQMDIPYDKIMMLVVAVAIIVASTELTLNGVAPWHDVYTLFLIILSGLGFMSAGYYAGEAQAYKKMYEQEKEGKK
jgi:hypothetical protein